MPGGAGSTGPGSGFGAAGVTIATASAPASRTNTPPRMNNWVQPVTPVTTIVTNSCRAAIAIIRPCMKLFSTIPNAARARTTAASSSAAPRPRFSTITMILSSPGPAGPNFTPLPKATKP